MKKRGLSELVSVVLLIAATISVGLIIFTFSRTSSERITSQVKMMSNQIECSDVQLSIESIDAKSLVLKNRGTLGISDIVFRTYQGTDTKPKYAKDTIFIWQKEVAGVWQSSSWSKLMPGVKIKTSNLNSHLAKLDIIPVISVDNQDIGCEDKILSWKE